MGQYGDLGVAKDGDAVFIHGNSAHLLGMPVSILGMFQSLPGPLLPGLMILFLMGFRGTAMSVGRTVVQLGGSLVIFVVRSVVITSRHL
jgi:hypothetical protein